MSDILKLDKKFTPFLIKAIYAANNSDFVIIRKYDLENFYISFKDIIHQKDGREYYTINFYAKEVTQDNWMDASPGEFGGINVDIDIKTKEVIYIYGSR